MKQLQRIDAYEQLTVQSTSFTIDGKRYAYDDSLVLTEQYKPITEQTARQFLQVVVDAKQGKVAAQQLQRAIEHVQTIFEVVEMQ